MGSTLSVALRRVSFGGIGGYRWSGVDLGAAWTVSARVASFFSHFLLKMWLSDLKVTQTLSFFYFIYFIV